MPPHCSGFLAGGLGADAAWCSAPSGERQSSAAFQSAWEGGGGGGGEGRGIKGEVEEEGWGVSVSGKGC